MKKQLIFKSKIISKANGVEYEFVSNELIITVEPATPQSSEIINVYTFDKYKRLCLNRCCSKYPKNINTKCKRFRDV